MWLFNHVINAPSPSHQKKVVWLWPFAVMGEWMGILLGAVQFHHRQIPFSGTLDTCVLDSIFSVVFFWFHVKKIVFIISCKKCGTFWGVQSPNEQTAPPWGKNRAFVSSGLPWLHRTPWQSWNLVDPSCEMVDEIWTSDIVGLQYYIQWIVIMDNHIFLNRFYMIL